MIALVFDDEDNYYNCWSIKLLIKGLENDSAGIWWIQLLLQLLINKIYEKLGKWLRSHLMTTIFILSYLIRQLAYLVENSSHAKVPSCHGLESAIQLTS